jgi:hypothetical protein
MSEACVLGLRFRRLLVKSDTKTRQALWITALLLLLATPRMALAYVDPGSGAMIWQVAAGLAVGSLFYVRRVAMKIKELVHSSKKEVTVQSFASQGETDSQKAFTV